VYKRQLLGERVGVRVGVRERTHHSQKIININIIQKFTW
jgi:hypothetical protein